MADKVTITVDGATFELADNESDGEHPDVAMLWEAWTEGGRAEVALAGRGSGRLAIDFSRVTSFAIESEPPLVPLVG